MRAGLLPRIVLLGVLACAVERVRAAGVVADAQTELVGDGAWMLRLRSSAPLAFDAATAHGDRRVVDRLHDATLGSMPASSKAAFGRVKLRRRGPTEVLVRLKLRKGWRAHVRQGPAPNVVDVRVVR